MGAKGGPEIVREGARHLMPGVISYTLPLPMPPLPTCYGPRSGPAAWAVAVCDASLRVESGAPCAASVFRGGCKPQALGWGRGDREEDRRPRGILLRDRQSFDPCGAGPQIRPKGG